MVSLCPGALDVLLSWPVRSADIRAVAASVLRNGVLARGGGGAGGTVADGWLPEAGGKLRRGRRRHGRERAAVGHARLQVAELPLQVSLKPAVVFALDG